MKTGFMTPMKSSAYKLKQDCSYHCSCSAAVLCCELSNSIKKDQRGCKEMHARPLKNFLPRFSIGH